MSEKIALIGAGAMGGAIGTRFLKTGNSLKVFDLDAERVAALVAKGALRVLLSTQEGCNIACMVLDQGPVIGKIYVGLIVNINGYCHIMCKTDAPFCFIDGYPIRDILLRYVLLLLNECLST